ncbi:MAG TPA: helix-turn-helix domain-containing protein [Longimicrobium sp.]|nr:helix-turn-helix domain-containing protein [Longimicrobium sp.]
MKQRNTRRVIVLQGMKMGGLDHVAAPFAVEPPVGWGEVDEVAKTAPPSAVVLLDPYAGRRPGEAFPRLHDLLRRFPSLTVVAAFPLQAEAMGDVDTLLAWGVAEVVDTGPEATARALHARLRQAHARPLKRKLERALGDKVSGDARNLLLAAAEVAVEGGGAPELAALLDVAPRTLTERCARADLPPPRQVQAWMRILLACILLDDPGRTVYAAAWACGYSTDRSLRRAVSEFVGIGASELRRGGAFEQAARALNAVLFRLREEGRERRRAERLAGRMA